MYKQNEEIGGGGCATKAAAASEASEMAVRLGQSALIAVEERGNRRRRRWAIGEAARLWLKGEGIGGAGDWGFNLEGL